MINGLVRRLSRKGWPLTTKGAANSLSESIWNQPVRILSQGSPHEMLEIALYSILNATKTAEGLKTKEPFRTWDLLIKSWDVLRAAKIITSEIEEIITDVWWTEIPIKRTIELWIKFNVESLEWGLIECEISKSDFNSMIKKVLYEWITISINDDRR